MLKKSLKFGSILLLLLSLIFVIGCSNGSTGETPDEGEVPDTPSSGVTKVIINPGNVNVAQGAEFEFTAEVEGVGDYDSSVTWEVLPPEIDEPAILPGTVLTPSAGSDTAALKVDVGEKEGRVLRIVATSGGVSSDVVEVEILRRGPHFAWRPKEQDVYAGTSGITITGILDGFTIDEYDIWVKNGPFREGASYDYYVDRQTGVYGGVITVTGNRNTKTVTVVLDASTLSLADDAETGLIRINLFPEALVGADKALVNETVDDPLIFRVHSQYGIDVLYAGATNVDITNIAGGPKQGQDPLTGLSNLNTNITLKSLTWAPLSPNGKFIKKADNPLKATVVLEANAGYSFVNTIDEAAIAKGGGAAPNNKNFTGGSPVIGDIKNTGRFLEFTLTYEVIAQILGDTAGGGVEIVLQATNPEFTTGGVKYGLNDFLPSSPTRSFRHTEEVPLEVPYYENRYYSAAVKWDGPGISADGKTFAGGRGTQTKAAVATVTLSPKVGYTFTDTDIVAANIESGIYATVSGGAAAKYVGVNDEGELVYTVTYDVAEYEIAATNAADYFKAENFTALIGRPIHGNPYGVSGDFTATAASPYTGTVSWTRGDGSSAATFNAEPLAAIQAAVKLTAKPGYKFTGTWTGAGAALLPAAALTIPTNTSGTNVPAAPGSVTLTGDYTLGFTLNYSTAGASPKPVLRRVDTLVNIINSEIALDPLNGKAFTGGPGTSHDTTKIATVTHTVKSLPGGKFTRGDAAQIQVTLAPHADYTFIADTGEDPYFTAANLAAYFNRIYTGLSPEVPAADQASVVEGPWLLGTGGTSLVFTLEYKTIKTGPILVNDLNKAGIGDFAATPASTGPIDIPTEFTGGTSDKYTVSAFAWTEGGTPVDFSGPAPTFSAGNYVLTFDVLPEEGYTFKGSNTFTQIIPAEVEALHIDAATTGTGWNNTNATPANAGVAKPGGIKVELQSNVVNGTDVGKLKITLTWTIT
jgi:hypothetical protein